MVVVVGEEVVVGVVLSVQRIVVAGARGGVDGVESVGAGAARNAICEEGDEEKVAAVVVAAAGDGAHEDGAEGVGAGVVWGWGWRRGRKGGGWRVPQQGMAREETAAEGKIE